MKNQKIAFSLCLLLTLSVYPETTMARSIADESSILHSILINGQTCLAIFLLALVTFLTFGFQMQNVDEMGIGAGDLLKQMWDFKKDVEEDRVTTQIIANEPYSDAAIFLKWMSDPASREEKIKRACFNEKDEAILTNECKALIDFLTSKNIRYEPPINPVLKFVLDEIIETTNTVTEFDPKTQRWTAKYEWIWRAVSKGNANSDREIWADSFFKGLEDQKSRFYTALDKLADAFAKKVHLLTPEDHLFAYHNDADESLMKEQIAKDVALYNIGIEYKDWEVQWDESKREKTPEKRFKRAFIFGNPNDGTGYSRLYQVNLIQDYQGNGKYSETYAKYLNSWPRPGQGKKSKSESEPKEPKTKSTSKAQPELRSKARTKSK